MDEPDSNSEVQVRKYAVALDPRKVNRMREEARRAAVREGRDVTWVGVLRALMDQFLTDARTDDRDMPAGGGR